VDEALVAAVVLVLAVSVVFSMFGLGGGVLYTPILLLLGFAVSASVSTALVLNLVVAIMATLVFYRGGLVDVRKASVFVPGIVVGSLIGGALSVSINPYFLLWLLVAVLAGAGGRMLYTYWEKGTDVGAEVPPFSTPLIAIIVPFSFGVGVLSALLGVGGGVLIIPFLIFACKFPVKQSAGATAYVVVFSSLFGVIGHSTVANLDTGLIAVTATAALIGAVLGARFTTRTPSRTIRVGLGLILVGFAAQLVLRLFGAI
jgi:uncharacterized protein